MDSEKISVLYEDYCLKANTAVEQKNLSNDYIQAHNYFLEGLASSNASSLIAFLQKENEKNILYVAPWIRMLCMKLIVLEMPDNLEILKWCYYDLTLFYMDEDEIIIELKSRIQKIDGSFQ